MPRLVEFISEARQTLNEGRITSDREQPAADREFNVEFGCVARTQRLASDREARLKPVGREMQQIEPIVPSTRVLRLISREALDELGLIPKLNRNDTRKDCVGASLHPAVPAIPFGNPIAHSPVR